jgi:hypothetical protein
VLLFLRESSRLTFSLSLSPRVSKLQEVKFEAKGYSTDRQPNQMDKNECLRCHIYIYIYIYIYICVCVEK